MHMMIVKLALGAVMIALTAIIHATMCDFVFKFIENHAASFERHFKKFWKIFALTTSIFMIGAALMIDIWLWTLLFYALEPQTLKDLDSALYFTTITFTTVGFGDIVLSPEWRLLSASTAINGMIIFGWSTAFIFEIMTALYLPSDKNRIQYGRRQYDRHHHHHPDRME